MSHSFVRYTIPLLSVPIERMKQKALALAIPVAAKDVRSTAFGNNHNDLSSS